MLVVQGAGEWAYFGELCGADAVRAGVVAVVIDGWARDLESVGDLPLTVSARGTTPRGAAFGPGGQIGVPLTLGETTVSPGDLVVADDDGLTVVPAGTAERVVADAVERARFEAEVAARCRAGASLWDLTAALRSPDPLA